MRKRWILLILIIIIIAGLAAAYSFWPQQPAPEPTVVVNTAPQPRVVSAEAFVVPVRRADLSFEVGGRIASLEVEEGDEVEAGAILAQLDNATQQAGLAEAKAGLAEAQASLAQQEASVAEAASRVAEAEADLANTKADPTVEEIAQLQAALAKAEAALAQTLTGASPEEIAEAQARVRSAQAELNRVSADTRSEELEAAGSQMLRAEADVREAQSVYDRVRYGDPKDVMSAGVTLEKATLEYETAKAEYDKLLNGATPEEIAVAQAQVVEAQAGLATIAAGATEAEIAQTQADVAQAEANLAQLLAGATDEEIAIAEARVETARASLEIAKATLEASKARLASSQAQVDSAQVQVDQTIMTAPFNGTVSSLNGINEGEIVQAGTEVVSLGDTSIWQVETDDLTEIDVVDVELGANVTISIDALPDAELEGKVVRITPKAETKAGDQTYTILIDITRGDTSKLRWGMTTFVDIETDSGLAAR
jgi:HlyD family secretion protein